MNSRPMPVRNIEYIFPSDKFENKDRAIKLILKVDITKLEASFLIEKQIIIDHNKSGVKP